MNDLYLLQILVNILFAVGIIYCVVRLRKEDQFARVRESHRDKLSAFLVSLEKTVKQGQKMSYRVVADVESRKKDMRTLTQLVENEKKALMELLEEVKTAGYSSESLKQKFQKPWINDKYSKALELSAEGFNPQQIADRINIPLGEIELILSLRK